MLPCVLLNNDMLSLRLCLLTIYCINEEWLSIAAPEGAHPVTVYHLHKQVTIRHGDVHTIVHASAYIECHAIVYKLMRWNRKEGCE